MSEEKREKTSREEMQKIRREARRRRRIRNQIIAYVVVVLSVLLLVFGSFKLVTTFIKLHRAVKQQEAVAQAQKEFDELEAQREEEQAQLEQETAEAETQEEELPELSEEELALQRLDEIVNAAITVMPIEDKVAGLFLVSPEAITGVDVAVKAGDGTKEALGKHPVGGIVYSASNVQDADQIKEMLANTAMYVSYPTFFAVTEEGGAGGAITGAGIGSKVDGPSSVAATGDSGVAYTVGCSLGVTLTGVGINLNLAPVADVAASGSILGDRSYGDNPSGVTTYVTNMIQGLSDYGVNSCMKYFPGMGSVPSDPADGAVVSDKSSDAFWAEELSVYQAVLNANGKMVMMSNAGYTGLDASETPASLSDTIINGLLRSNLGFQGVVVSGNLSDKAITDTYSADRAAVAALNAGCDMLYNPSDYQAAVTGILTALSDGELSTDRIDEALRRIYRVKFADKVNSEAAAE